MSVSDPTAGPDGALPPPSPGSATSGLAAPGGHHVHSSRGRRGGHHHRQRRNRVNERLAWIIALASGVGCALAAPRPVPSTVISVVLLFATGAVVAWAGASTPWWALAVASAVAAVVAEGPAAFVLATVAFLAAAYVGARTRGLDEVRAVAAGLLVNAFARTEFEWFFGASAAIGITVCLVVVALGVRRRPRQIRRRVWAVVAGVGLAIGVATLGVGVAAASARSSLEAGNRDARSGLRSLSDARFDEASGQFRSAQAWFEQADDHMSAVWTWPARAVPFVAQHAVAVDDLAEEAADASEVIGDEVGGIDADSVRLVDGRVDIAAVEALAEPIGALEVAVGDLLVAVDEADSPWLLPRVRAELTDLRDELDRNAYRLTTAGEAVDLAPQMLGGDGRRRYLVLFTTPSEARGLGGFVGNYAEMVADEGRISMPTFGRIQDLKGPSTDPDVTVVGPEGFLERYGRFGFDPLPGGGISQQAWSNVTIPPDMPTVGAVAAELYAQTGGRAVDGVVVVDPYVVQALVGFTGPITVEGWPEPLTSANTAQVLLKDQYLLEETGGDRIDFLEDAARTTFELLLAGSLPGPAELGRTLSPLAHEGRLLMWTPDAAEQEMLRRSSLLGEFPDFDGGDGIGLALTNGGGNKVDAYLERAVTYRSVLDEVSGETTGELEVELTNTAPSSGMPSYVLNNIYGLPQGSSRLLVCVFTPLELDAVVTEGDDDSPWERYQEFGLNEYCRGITIGPGGTVTVRFQLRGVLADPERPVEVWEQPLVEPLEIDVSAG